MPWRWFDIAIAPLAEIRADPEKYETKPGGSGTFLLAVPTLNEPLEVALLAAKQAADEVQNWDLVVGLSQEAWSFTSLARELLAIEQVRNESPELQGDRVARREIEARIANLRGYIESELNGAFDTAIWYARGCQGEQLSQAELNRLASDLSDLRFKATPLLNNELLNRLKPSSNAIAAQNFLLRRMALHEGEERLGIVGYPAEGGLFTSLLEENRAFTDICPEAGVSLRLPEKLGTISGSLELGKPPPSCWNPIRTGRSRFPRFTRSGMSNLSASRTACCPYW